jgi:hypothetical protein
MLADPTAAAAMSASARERMRGIISTRRHA